MIMSKLSDKAFAVMAMCEETKQPFGITVDPKEGYCVFSWAFKVKVGQASREGYDKTRVKGGVMYAPDFNGCPYCGSKSFYICARCGKIVCYHEQEFVTCPNCGNASSIRPQKSVDLSGEGF